MSSQSRLGGESDVSDNLPEAVLQRVLSWQPKSDGLTSPLEHWASLGDMLCFWSEHHLGTHHSIAEQTHGIQAYLQTAKGRRLHTFLLVGELGWFCCVDTSTDTTGTGEDRRQKEKRHIV